MIKWHTCDDCKFFYRCYNERVNELRECRPELEDTPIPTTMVKMHVCPKWRSKNDR